MKATKYINKYFTKVIWSFLVNVAFWVKNRYYLQSAILIKKAIKAKMKTVDDIQKEIFKFKWTKDTIRDWYPWVITIIENQFKDDCDGAAHYGKWLFKCIGIKADIVHLFSDTQGHAVCITKDKKYMISNQNLIKIKGNWEKFVLEYFGNTYKYII